jgi:hypothetical protein
MAQCMTAGRRRKMRNTGRKTGRKGRRTMKGGVFYGVGSAITPGAMEYKAVSGSQPYGPDGRAKVDPFDTTAKGGDSVMLGGRRRKSRKSKKSRKVRRSRTMRGGAPVYNAGQVGTSFTGAIPDMPGSQTYGGYTGYNTRAADPSHVTGPDGVVRI